MSLEHEIKIVEDAGLDFDSITHHGYPRKYVCRLVDVREWKRTGSQWPTHYLSERCETPAAAIKNALAKARAPEPVEDYSDLC